MKSQTKQLENIDVLITNLSDALDAAHKAKAAMFDGDRHEAEAKVIRARALTGFAIQDFKKIDDLF